MKNETVAGIMKDAQQFWIKWRDCVPERDSKKWDEIHKEVAVILERYGTRKSVEERDGVLLSREEFISGSVVLWFLELLEERAREHEDGKGIFK